MRIIVLTMVTLAPQCGTTPAGPGPGPGGFPAPCILDFMLSRVSDYNVVTLDDYTAANSDVEGRMLVGGDLSVENYSVGLLDQGGVSAVVGGSASIHNGSLYGDIVWGASASLTNVGFPVGGVSTQGTPVNFSFVDADLTDLSDDIAALPSNGTTTVTSWGGIELNGSDPLRNVFRMSSNDLTGAVSFTLNAPSTSTVIVDIVGTNVSMTNFGFAYNGHPQSQVLFNVNDSSTVHMSGVGFEGTLLAPYSSVDFINGQMNGQLWIREFDGDIGGQTEGQLNWLPFDGRLCP